MKAKIIFILCCVSCLFLTSCKKTHCPGFPEHLLDYFPYQNGEIFSFENQHNDTLSFWVREIMVSKKRILSYNRCGKCGGGNCDNPWFSFIAHCLISKSRADEMGISFIEVINGKLITNETLNGAIGVAYDNREKSYITISIPDAYCDFDYTYFRGGSSYVLEESGKDFFDPKNSTIFGDTVIFENSENQISHVVIVKGKGITEFYDQKYDFQWKITQK